MQRAVKKRNNSEPLEMRLLEDGTQLVGLPIPSGFGARKLSIECFTPENEVPRLTVSFLPVATKQGTRLQIIARDMSADETAKLTIDGIDQDTDYEAWAVEGIEELVANPDAVTTDEWKRVEEYHRRQIEHHQKLAETAAKKHASI